MDLDAIFKAYDVRGVYPSQLNEELVEKIGKAYATFVTADTLMVGHDMRNSAASLVEACVKGIVSTGKNVQLTGLVPTDASYYAAGKHNLPFIMFTASHNPPEYNGMKFTDAGAIPIGIESGLAEVRRILEEERWDTSDTPGTVSEIDVVDDFVEHALGMVDQTTIKPLKIAIDAGNGMGGFIAPKVFDKLPTEVLPLYFELDGNMPNHEPNPIDPENVQDLIALVKESGAELGIAFDGDADRAFFIDEKGGRVSASLITAMLAKNVLEKHPGSTIIYNVVCSRIVKETIENNGGTAVMERVGHSYIKKTMKDTGAIFAGEHSGHYYFLDNYRADSGLIAALMVLECISEKGVSLSEALAEFQVYAAIEETNSKVDDKEAVIAKLKEVYADAQIEEFDGTTFTTDTFWFNVRPSNTEPLLRLNLEAVDEATRDEKAAEVLAIIRG